MAGGAHILALVEATVKHLVPGSSVGKRGSFACIRADEILSGTTLGVIRRRQIVGEEVRAIELQDALSQGMERVIIVDYDAHHGNGTQAAFLKDERAAYLSTHQAGIYPGTGSVGDAPQAKGRIVNVPLPAYAGNQAFQRIADEVIQPMIETFRPEMIFVSAGFDAHWSDPLTTLGLSSAGFFNLSQRLVELAGEHCQGKIVFVLEGGYDPTNVANGVEAVFEALANSRSGFDAGDTNPYQEPDIESRLDEVCKWHGF